MIRFDDEKWRGGGEGKGKNNEQVDNLQPTFEFHRCAGFVEKKTFHNLATLSILPYPSRCRFIHVFQTRENGRLLGLPGKFVSISGTCNSRYRSKNT